MSVRLVAADVVHSFFVPAFLVKKDLIPGVDNSLEIRPSTVGRFPAVCAEFCGLDHWRMTFDVEVVSPEAFQAFVADQQRCRAAGPRGHRPGRHRPAGPACVASDAPRGAAGAAAAQAGAAGPRQRDGRLVHHHRPQEDRHPLHGHRLRVLPAGRRAGPADAGRAGPARPRPGRRVGLQPAVHHARQHHDVPVRGADGLRLRQLPGAAAAGRPRHGLPPAQRPVLLAVPRAAASPWSRASSAPGVRPSSAGPPTPRCPTPSTPPAPAPTCGSWACCSPAWPPS